MSLWLQIKYLKFLPLQQFTEKGGQKWNFRCPICGDSQRSETKKRCWATEYKGNLSIKCFNCDYSNSFHGFLKYNYPYFYTDYIKEKFDVGDIGKKIIPKEQSKVDLFADEFKDLNLQKIKVLPWKHKAVKYLRDRQIPIEFYNEFYYSSNFAKWINTEIEEGAIKFESDFDRRIIIPFFDKYKKIFAVQGRGIEYQTPKYLKHKFDKECDLIYGLDRIDFTKRVYVVEGMLDSLFLDNCLAVSGALADIKSILKYTSKENITIVPDNDFRNKYTDKFVLKLINAGFSIVLWPKGTPFKDINDGIKLLTIDEIRDIISYNTFTGLKAITKFKMRRM